MKWQLYNKENYSEIYFRGDTPRSLEEWETVVRANPECVYWLSPDAFITQGYAIDWLKRATRDKRNFPRSYFCVGTTKQLLFIWATSEMEAFRTLYEMTMYSDFASSFEKLWPLDDETTIKLPTLLLKEVLKNNVNPLEFDNLHLQSAFAGRVLAQSGQITKLTLAECAFEPAAEEAFVEGILSRTDKSNGLRKLHFLDCLPFRSDQNLVRLLMSEYGPMEFSYLFPDSRYSEEMLISLRNSPGLQSLALCSEILMMMVINMEAF